MSQNKKENVDINNNKIQKKPLAPVEFCGFLFFSQMQLPLFPSSDSFSKVTQCKYMKSYPKLQSVKSRCAALISDHLTSHFTGTPGARIQAPMNIK